MSALAMLNDKVATALAGAQSASSARLAIYHRRETGLNSQFQQLRAAIARPIRPP